MSNVKDWDRSRKRYCKYVSRGCCRPEEVHHRYDENEDDDGGGISEKPKRTLCDLNKCDNIREAGEGRNAYASRNVTSGETSGERAKVRSGKKRNKKTLCEITGCKSKYGGKYEDVDSESGSRNKIPADDGRDGPIDDGKGRGSDDGLNRDAGLNRDTGLNRDAGPKSGGGSGAGTPKGKDMGPTSSLKDMGPKKPTGRGDDDAGKYKHKPVAKTDGGDKWLGDLDGYPLQLLSTVLVFLTMCKIARECMYMLIPNCYTPRII